MATGPSPTLRIHLSLSTPIFRRFSSLELQLPTLTVSTTLHSPHPITLDTRGPLQNGTVLTNASFSFQHFSFYDLTTDQPFTYPAEERECGNTGGTLSAYDLLTLQPDKEYVTYGVMEDFWVPLGMLEVGHEYRISLEPVDVWWTYRTQKELLGGKGYLEVDEGEMARGSLVRVESGDELRLKVEE
jgi:hypothetical protein